MLVSMQDKDYLQKALELSTQSPEKVGCATVLVQDGQIVAKTYNSQHADGYAVFHAEVKALLIANSKTGSRTLKNATAYCSCEPCAMCVTALSYAKIPRIIFCHDKSDLFPDDPQSTLDTFAYVKGLNFVPELIHMPLKELEKE